MTAREKLIAWVKAEIQNVLRNGYCDSYLINTIALEDLVNEVENEVRRRDGTTRTELTAWVDKIGKEYVPEWCGLRYLQWFEDQLDSVINEARKKCT